MTLASTASGSVQAICPELLLQELRSGVSVLIVDVRDRSDVRAFGAIAGARSIPLEQLGPRIDELSDHHASPVVVVDQDDHLSRAAVTTLALAGFADVTALEGGMARWLELGYPVEPRPIPGH